MPDLVNDLQKLLGNSNLLGDLDDNVQELKKIIQVGSSDLTTKTVTTKYGDSSNQLFTTDVGIGDEDIKNTFPSEPPKADNVYWKRHNDLVDKYLDARRDIVLKAIEVTGNTIKGLINPMSG